MKGAFGFSNGQTRSIEERKIDIPVVDNAVFRRRLVARIEETTLKVIEQISSGRLPYFSYNLFENDEAVGESPGPEEPHIIDQERQRNGTRTDFANRRSKEKFALMMTVMATAHRLLITNTTITRRSLYYDLKNGKTSDLVPTQRQLDQAVNHVSNFLNCAPWELHLLPSSKGLVAGDLSLTLVGNRVIDCTVPGSALIPQIISNVISIRARAKFVLILEKDAVFQKLLEDDCAASLDCILVTGKGYPDVATRMLVKLLSEELQLPVYAIVDADPFGVDIMCVYRFGSAALSRERESLACPSVRWLGVHPSELLALGVNTIPLTAFDLSKLTALENRPYITDALRKELRVMRTGKAEIENVSSFSRKFLSATYLPCKIRGEDYI